MPAICPSSCRGGSSFLPFEREREQLLPRAKRGDEKPAAAASRDSLHTHTHIAFEFLLESVAAAAAAAANLLKISSVFQARGGDLDSRGLNF